MDQADLRTRFACGIAWTVLSFVCYFVMMKVLWVFLDARGRYAADWGMVVGVALVPVGVAASLTSVALGVVTSGLLRVVCATSAIGVGLGLRSTGVPVLGDGLALGGLSSCVELILAGRPRWQAWLLMVALAYPYSVFTLLALRYGKTEIVSGPSAYLLALPFAVMLGSAISPVSWGVFRVAGKWLLDGGGAGRPD